MKKILTIILLVCVAIKAEAQLRIPGNGVVEKILNTEQAIYHLYVDTVNEEKLAEDAIRGMLEKLDPHSSYSTPKEVKAMKEPLEGSFEGIGVQFNMLEDTLVVIQPVFNGPSEKVGILAGDRIIAVNDTAIAGVKMPREDIMKRLRGKKGSKVKLTVRRRLVADDLTFTVVREKIPVKTVDAVYMLEPAVGYIRLGSFGSTTYKEFMEGTQKLADMGMKTLVIDLQENGGGYLQSAVEIAGEILQEGDLIVYTKGRRYQPQRFFAKGSGKLRHVKVVVLINEFSASAAEILAGAIQDQDRGTIVGRRSFGKGLVQRPIEFDDGSMIRLTVAHYYTPSGRCIQKPYKKGDMKDYEMDLDRRLKHGELTSPDSIHFDDSLKYHTLRNRRVVYGGGGIMPDEFVPLDTMRYTRLHRQLMVKSIVINQSLKYIDQNRKTLKKTYPTFDRFLALYEIPDKLVDDIIAEGMRQGIKPRDDEEATLTKSFLKNQLKSLVARDLWDMTEYFRIYNHTNDIVTRALDVIHRDH